MTEFSSSPKLDRNSDGAFWPDALAVAIGTLITLVVSGYQFGRGNHTVYLLEGLRIADPTLFRNDWFVTSTLQYHAIFSWFTAVLMKLDILQPAFLVCYVALAILWHVAWLKFTRRLGGSRITYLFSVVLFYLSAAGIALGVYQFLQDGCFLPSNVSTIAMLWGFYFWTADRRIAAGLCLGIAGMFHLNFAVMACAMWGILSLWDLITRDRTAPPIFSWRMLVGLTLLLIPSLFNIIHALQVKLRESGSIPLDEFVNVYVRFRHTHHFNAIDWPIALWVAFLWPIPFAIYAWCVRMRRASGNDRRTLRLTSRIFVFFLGIQCIALLFASVWFVSESLVQLMLWRFSIYIKLLSCMGAAYVILCCRARIAILWIVPLALCLCLLAALLLEHRDHPRWLDLALGALRDHRAAFVLFALLSFVPALMGTIRYVPRTPAPYVGGLLACLLTLVIGWNRWLGWGMTPEPVDAEYLQLCQWAREATPVDAIFVVPPSDTVFRLEAQRAIVVNFKHVPQLSGEITLWLDRLTDVLGTREVDSFPRDYIKLLPALDARYETRSPAQLIEVAHKYTARYIVVDHDLGAAHRPQLAYHSPRWRYYVYDVGR